MEISNIQNNRYYTTPQSFKGVTKKLSKTVYLYPQKELKNYIAQRGDKNAFVGKLPSFMLQKLDKEHFREAIKEIIDTFGEASRELHDFQMREKVTLKEIMTGRSQEAVDKLKSVFVKYKILSQYDDFDLVYLGKGGKGSVYKLSGLKDFSHPDEDEFVIKVFHTNELNESYVHHGAYAEINAAAYWMKNVGFDTNRGKFFFGDLKNGYMISKYIDEDVRLAKRKVDFAKQGLEFTDENGKMGHNVVKGYHYDWGGCRQLVNFVNQNDSVFRRTYNYIMTTPKQKRLAEWLKKFEAKSQHKDSEYAALAKCIPYLPKENQAELVQKCSDLNNPRVNNILENENLTKLNILV